MLSARCIGVSLIVIVKLNKLAGHFGTRNFLALGGVISQEVERLECGKLYGIVNVPFCAAAIINCCV